MVEGVFEQSFSVTSRLAAVRAATITALYGLPKDIRRDLAQEVVLELWRKRTAYDTRRGCWRTFSERVVANRMTSLVRSMQSARSGQFKEDPLETVLGLAVTNDGTELRTDVSRVLARASPFDRAVAWCLMEHSAVEASRKLGVCRATVYRAMVRLRVAFTEAGLSPCVREPRPNADLAGAYAR